MRARLPDQDGFIERDGVKIGYEAFGVGERTLLFLPTWTMIHSRCWKAQVPYFARRFRVVTFDTRGNGRSDRVTDPTLHDERETARDAVAVLDVLGVQRAGVVGLSRGGRYVLRLWELAPERVEKIALIASAAALEPGQAAGRPSASQGFEVVRDSYQGWQKYNRHYWRSNYRDWVEFFVGNVFTEPHSSKQVEDGIGWALETTPEVLIASVTGSRFPPEEQRRIAASITCPVLVIHGDEDQIVPHESGRRLAELTGGSLVTMAGSGHSPQARDPVRINLLLRDFFAPAAPARTWTRASRRPKRALYLSSPIGLGHAQRDVAVAQALRELHPDLQIDWLAQDPVTRVLQAEGETIHPASAFLASESQHIESESAEHDLHCFSAWRRMDEILVNNFMVVNEVVEERDYDLWIGDEAWELDYFLHENPELKRAAYCWFTDFVGWIPMPDGGPPEASLTADYNAEMIEQIARYPRLRDRAIFVGDPDDIVADTFGPGLPKIRDWTEERFRFSGYITGFDPAAYADTEAVRAELGYRPDEKVCVVTVGGSGVGGHLLRRVIDAFPAAKRAVPELRMILVCGPRIDPAGLPQPDGLEVRRYVHKLYRHLAVCDLAVIQGGLTTAMELTANRRPFIYVPLRHHFEQNYHVRHRLERYGAGRCMLFDECTGEALAHAIAADIGREVTYAPVDPAGAARAAAMIAELL
jgi:pimeloyl-ACP methyl ester carboxylesterase/predicted glycosyltransferase